MWKCRECGGEILEVSKSRIDEYGEVISYVDISHLCEECLVETDEGIRNIAEWEDEF